jgi:hypothetical protein
MCEKFLMRVYRTFPPASPNMKLNINGLVESQSVQNAERILVKSIQREKMFHRISSNYLFLLALS